MSLNSSKLSVSKKKYSTSVVLTGFFGILGINHFYLGRWAMGAFDLGLSICVLYFYLTDNFLIAFCLFMIDLIHTVIVTYLLLTGQYKDGNGLIVPYPGQNL